MMRINHKSGLWGRSPIWLGLMAIAVLLFNVLAQADEGRLTATVDYAKSGNTLELLFELSPELPVTTIRLAAIEAPDRDQAPWGEAARACLADLHNQIIYLAPVAAAPDQYDRLWAYGWLGRQSINERSLAAGCSYLADPSEAGSLGNQPFLYAQEQARLLGLGIWNPANPLRETAAAFRERSHSP